MNVKSYLQAHARKLDLYLYEYLFEGRDGALLSSAAGIILLLFVIPRTRDRI